MAIAVAVEAGTSVAPRQRPKAASAAALQGAHNLPLVAPPSPSPRNPIASPSIPPTPLGGQQSVTTAAAPAPAASEPIDAFPAQFQANFPPVAATTSGNTTAVGTPCTAAAVTPADPNLFKTSFPDPFVETARDVPAVTAAAVAAAARTPSAPSSLHGSGHALFAAAAAVAATADGVAAIQPKDVVASPIKSVAAGLSALTTTTNIGGHRRNVSDTSAFNK